jgi:hypothetical protein
MAERHVQEKPELARPVEVPPPPKQDLDQIFLELVVENPANPLYQWILARRERAKAEGHPLDAERTAGLLGLEVMGEIAHRRGTHGNRQSSDVPASGHT